MSSKTFAISPFTLAPPFRQIFLKNCLFLQIFPERPAPRFDLTDLFGSPTFGFNLNLLFL